MSKVNLLCSDKSVHGKNLVLPFVGEVTVTNEGLVSVPQEVADFMLENGGDGWSLAEEAKEESKSKEKAAPVKKETAKKEEPKGEKEEEEEADDADEPALKKADLEKLELEELISTAKEAGIPAKDYKKFKENKKLMVSFLLKTINK